MSCPKVIRVVTPGPPGPPGGGITLSGPAVLGREDPMAGGPVALPLGAGLMIASGALAVREVSAAAAGLVPAGWVSGATAATLPHIHGNLAGVLYHHIRPVGAPLSALMPYKIVGNQGDTDRVQIVAADAGDPQTMPASGILPLALAQNADGHGAIAGDVQGVNTAAYAPGTVLYVAVGGGLTATMPASNVQMVAVVGRQHATTGTVIPLVGPSLARSAYTGAYGDLMGRPVIPATPADIGAATAAQGAKADSAVQPAALASYVQTTDSRLSDVREWSAATVDQAEAEAGIATTRRAWTAQRVRQAVSAWWTGASTAAGRALVTAADAAAQRTSLGLGGAAVLSVGTTAGTVASGDAPAAAIAAIQNYYAVGNYIMPANTVVQAGTAVAASTIYLYPFDVLRPIRCNELVTRISTGVASSSFQLAVYGSTSANLPGQLLAATGDMSGTTVATVNSVVTEFTLLPGRVYWWAVNANGAIVFSTPSVSSTYLNNIIGLDSLQVVSSATNVLWNRAFAQTYGTWPDLTGQTTTATANNRCPNPILKISAFA